MAGEEWQEKWEEEAEAERTVSLFVPAAKEETPTKGLRQVMMYRGKFPAENYT